MEGGTKVKNACIRPWNVNDEASTGINKFQLELKSFDTLELKSIMCFHFIMSSLHSLLLVDNEIHSKSHTVVPQSSESIKTL